MDVDNSKDVNLFIDTVDSENKSLIYKASEDGDLKTVQYLLPQKPNLNIKHKDGWTLIHAAAAGGHDEILKEILESSDNTLMNERGHDNRTALYLATWNGHLQSVKLLLQYEADMNIRHKDGWSIYHAASYQGNLDILKMLLERDNTHLNDVTNDNRTPLYFASWNGKLNVVEHLISLNADVSVKQKDGFTAYHAAVFQGNLKVLEALLNYNEKYLNGLTNYNKTLLHLSSEQGHSEIVQYLLRTTINIDCEDKDGKTARDVAKVERVIELFNYKNRNSLNKSSEIFDVMLSYQWDNQNVVKELKTFLEHNGLRVWMDIEQMYDNIISRMQEAINQSEIIIFCMTKKYESSRNCRLEFNYAYKQNKTFIPIKFENFKPISELDIIIGNNLYYLFYDGNCIDQSKRDLLKTIKRLLAKSQ